MTELADRHEPVTAHAMARVWLDDLWREDPVDGDRVPVGGTLAECVQMMWPGWTPFAAYEPDDSREGELFVFTHPERGWGVAFVPGARSKWSANPAVALEYARNHSASGLSLTIVCERLINLKAMESSYSTLAVIEVLSAPLLQSVLAEQQVMFMLAMTGRMAMVQKAATWWGYPPLGDPASVATLSAVFESERSP